MNSIPHVSSSSGNPSIHSGTSIEGVTDLMKDTQFRHLAQEMVTVHELEREAQPEGLPGQTPILERVRLGLREANFGGANPDSSALNLVNESDKCTIDNPYIRRQPPLISGRGRKEENPKAEVVVYSPLHQASQVPKPGLLARQVAGCVNFIKRCFTGNAG